jgi:hypothetical protein
MKLFLNVKNAIGKQPRRTFGGSSTKWRNLKRLR